jgi:hypothetical protein
MPKLLGFMTATLASLAVPPATAADDAAPIQELGTRHRFVHSASSAYPAAGCRDHRALMFIVSEVEGDDPGAAKLLIERDCRPLVPGAEYIRCGPGGWAYPAKGQRLSYASYCRIGANDLALYALDAQMPNVAESDSKPR